MEGQDITSTVTHSHGYLSGVTAMEQKFSKNGLVCGTLQRHESFQTLLRGADRLPQGESQQIKMFRPYRKYRMWYFLATRCCKQGRRPAYRAHLSLPVANIYRGSANENIKNVPVECFNNIIYHLQNLLKPKNVLQQPKKGGPKVPSSGTSLNICRNGETTNCWCLAPFINETIVYGPHLLRNRL